MVDDKKEKQEETKYCPECGIIKGSEPFGVRCPLPNCPNRIVQ